METQQLVVDITTFLLPLLAEGSIVGVGEILSGSVLDRARQLWGSIVNKSKNEPAIQDVVVDLESNPTDPDLKKIFEYQLKKVLKRDPSFASEIRHLLEEAQLANSDKPSHSSVINKATHQTVYGAIGSGNTITQTFSGG